MNLYIETENGAVKNHPAFEDNLIQAFGSIPEHWEPFVRVERSTFGVYKIVEADTPTYEKVNGVWTDVWPVRDMTAEEKATKQRLARNMLDAHEQAENWSTWTLDEATCEMVPPVPHPEPIEGVAVLWCGADNNWKEAPAFPVDGNRYKFDFFAWQWVQLVN